MRFSKFDNTKYGSAHDLVEQISKNVPSHVQINTLKDTFPNGKVKGDVFYIGSLRGEEGDSLRIDINPRSNNFMRGQDFNGGDGVGGGGDDGVFGSGHGFSGDDPLLLAILIIMFIE